MRTFESVLFASESGGLHIYFDYVPHLYTETFSSAKVFFAPPLLIVVVGHAMEAEGTNAASGVRSCDQKPHTTITYPMCMIEKK